MTPEQSDDLDFVLDRFEIRVRRKQEMLERRIYAEHRKRLQAAMTLDEPRFRASVVRPSLDHYDNMTPKGKRRAQD